MLSTEMPNNTKHGPAASEPSYANPPLRGPNIHNLLFVIVYYSTDF